VFFSKENLYAILYSIEAYASREITYNRLLYSRCSQKKRIVLKRFRMSGFFLLNEIFFKGIYVRK